MKHLHLILAVAAGIMLAACSSDDPLIVETPQVTDTEAAEVPILFSSMGNPITRADYTGKEAATLLGNQFVVSGYKGSKTGTIGNIVFNNYLVEYTENTAHTTQSNVANWEYVGKGRIKHAIDNGITSQTIKYWDYTQPQYDFIAWSTGTATPVYGGTPADGQVLVSAITAKAATSPATGLAAAYTFTGKAADLAKCYIADVVTVKKTGTAGVGTVIGYGENPVTLRFRQLGTKVRIGIYETVPGYSVKNVQFYSAAASNDASAAAAKLFTTTANSIFTEGTYTITYPTVDTPTSDDNNQAHVAFAAKSGTNQATVVNWGALDYTIREEGEGSEQEIYLGRTSNTASFAGDADANYYVVYLPNESGTNLNLRVNYTLESIDGSKEEINVKGATAQVPSIYTTWKPGFAYTYLFKISDKTNGYTGDYDPLNPDGNTTDSNPAGLYPITFDAMVENAEDGDATQETITTVSAPSITTYQKGSTVVNADEYVAATGEIFVTAMKNGNLLYLFGNSALYTIPAGKTEADVVDALQIQDDDAAEGTIKGRSGLVLTKVTTNVKLDNKIEFGVDGNTISTANNRVMRFTPTAGTTYAFVFTDKKAEPAQDVVRYQALAWSSFATGATKYRYGYKDAAKTYENNNGTPNDATDDVIYYDAQKGVKYFKLEGSVYVMQNPFLGQTVNNLYLDAAGNTIASGYAKSEVTYYYTVDGGQHYIAAHNQAYGSPKTAGLYVKSGDSYVLTTDETPQSGTAYYYKSGDSYIYCVFLPEQTKDWKELDTTTFVKVESTETAKVAGQTYFEKYTQNNGVYYAKVIKVQ